MNLYWLAKNWRVGLSFIRVPLCGVGHVTQRRCGSDKSSRFLSPVTCRQGRPLFLPLLFRVKKWAKGRPADNDWLERWTHCPHPDGANLIFFLPPFLDKRAQRVAVGQTATFKWRASMPKRGGGGRTEQLAKYCATEVGSRDLPTVAASLTFSVWHDGFQQQRRQRCNKF